MSPFDWALQPLKRYADFSGRSPRAEYWWFYLATFIVDRVLTFIDERVLGQEMLLSGIFGLAILVPWIAVTVRRLHDTDRSGWWMMMFAVAAFLFVAILVQASLNGVDPDVDSPALFYVSAVLLVISALVIFVFMVLRGTVGANRYGSDPYQPEGDLEKIFA